MNRDWLRTAALLLGLLALGFAIGAGRDSVSQQEPDDRQTPRPQPTTGDKPQSTSAPAKQLPYRGVTISCPRNGIEWGWDETVDAMKDIQSLGADWVCIHPYAWIRADGSLSLRGVEMDPPPRWLTRPIEEAHRLGLKIMIKPHLGYWGSPFSWRGAIEFSDDAAWQRFFSQYTAWMNQVATVSKGADLLVVGTELDKMLRFEDRWRQVIAECRERYTGPLTYAANWTDYERVPFWDALDFIGIQAYFPITREGEDPTLENIRAGWRRASDHLLKYSTAQKKPVLFTELGYNHSLTASLKPWEYHTSKDPEAERIQRDCLTVALETIEREPHLVGSFLWKWFPGEYRPRNFSMMTPTMRKVISGCWAASARAAPAGDR